MSRVHVIAGPTASGKSARAMAVAREQNGVVINADSLQLYNALPILTAQPPKEDKTRTPHELYCVLSPAERCSAAQWREMAIRVIDRTHEDGKLPILVGGTGFYLNALMRGLSPMPDVPIDIRSAMTERLQTIGHAAFHAELAARDPVMAARLHPGDTQRMIRAREVIEATGRSLSVWQEAKPEPPPAHYVFTVELIDPPRAELYARCNTRFDAMLAAGAIEEAAAYNGPSEAPVTHALGFRPLRAYLNGEIKLAGAVEKSKAATRQYAKRQVTWFRHQLAQTPQSN